MAYQKNNVQAEKLAALSKDLGAPVRQIMLSDEHIDKVVPIFYDGLPKLARMAMTRDKFRAFFLNQRQKFADEMFPQA
jgi:hypothetical protein